MKETEQGKEHIGDRYSENSFLPPIPAFTNQEPKSHLSNIRLNKHATFVSLFALQQR